MTSVNSTEQARTIGEFSPDNPLLENWKYVKGLLAAVVSTNLDIATSHLQQEGTANIFKKEQKREVVENLALRREEGIRNLFILAQAFARFGNDTLPISFEDEIRDTINKIKDKLSDVSFWRLLQSNLLDQNSQIILWHKYNLYQTLLDLDSQDPKRKLEAIKFYFENYFDFLDLTENSSNNEIQIFFELQAKNPSEDYKDYNESNGETDPVASKKATEGHIFKNSGSIVNKYYRYIGMQDIFDQTRTTILVDDVLNQSDLSKEKKQYNLGKMIGNNCRDILENSDGSFDGVTDLELIFKNLYSNYSDITIRGKKNGIPFEIQYNTEQTLSVKKSETENYNKRKDLIVKLQNTLLSYGIDAEERDVEAVLREGLSDKAKIFSNISRNINANNFGWQDLSSTYRQILFESQQFYQNGSILQTNEDYEAIQEDFYAGIGGKGSEFASKVKITPKIYNYKLYRDEGGELVSG